MGRRPPSWTEAWITLEGFVAEEELSAGADGSEEEDFNLIPGLRQAQHHAGIDSTVAEPAGAAEGASLCEESLASGQLEMPPCWAWEADGFEKQYGQCFHLFS